LAISDADILEGSVATLADFDQGSVGDEVEARADCLWLDLEALE
jgi:hypothetical protein